MDSESSRCYICGRGLPDREPRRRALSPPWDKRECIFCRERTDVVIGKTKAAASEGVQGDGE